MEYKRITLLCGHYGSGKTNVAVNLALDIKKTRENVAIADLDIVNPYFRTRDSEKSLREAGIRLICSDYANSNVDIPALPQDMYAVTDDKTMTAVIDVGGDDRGALALGRIAPAILRENDYEMVMVINKYRPLTRTPQEVMEVMAEIETACGMRITALCNDSNLGMLTDAQTVLDSVAYADECSRLSGLPVIMTCVDERLFDELNGKIDKLFPLRLQEDPLKIRHSIVP